MSKPWGGEGPWYIHWYVTVVKGCVALDGDIFIFLLNQPSFKSKKAYDNDKAGEGCFFSFVASRRTTEVRSLGQFFPRSLAAEST